MFSYLLRNIAVISRDIARRLPRVLLSSFGIVFLISFVILFISFRTSVRDYLEKRIFNRLDINELIVTPENRTTFIKLNIFSQSFSEISTNEIRKIKRIEEIGSIQRVVRLNFPSSLIIGMFGRHMRTDILISGVERSFFRGTNISWKGFKAEDSIPVVVPYFALDLYNNFAAANSLPEVGEKALLGYKMEIVIGKSSFFRESGHKYTFMGKIFGFTSRLSTTGIIVPLEFIRKFCRRYRSEHNTGRKCVSCIMLVVRVKKSLALPGVVRSIERLGLNVESHKNIAEKTGRAIKFIDSIFMILIIILFILTVLAIFNSYLAIVYNRSYEISLQRMLGATKFRILSIFIIEASVIGIIYGIVGYYIGYYSITVLSKNVGNWIPLIRGLKITPDGNNLLLISVTISMLVSSLSALFPSIIAANLNLFRDVKR